MNKLKKELTKLRIEQLKRVTRRADEEFRLWKERNLMDIRRSKQLIEQSDWNGIMKRILKDPIYLEYVAKREEEKKEEDQNE